jgi:hypothetical protein
LLNLLKKKKTWFILRATGCKNITLQRYLFSWVYGRNPFNCLWVCQGIGNCFRNVTLFW